MRFIIQCIFHVEQHPVLQMGMKNTSGRRLKEFKTLSDTKHSVVTVTTQSVWLECSVSRITSGRIVHFFFFSFTCHDHFLTDQNKMCLCPFKLDSVAG